MFDPITQASRGPCWWAPAVLYAAANSVTNAPRSGPKGGSAPREAVRGLGALPLDVFEDVTATGSCFVVVGEDVA